MEISNNTTKNKVIKNIGVANRLFDNDYIESLKNVFDIIIGNSDVKHAQILLKVLKEAMATRKSELEAAGEINDFYKKIIIKLGFIALPLLDDADIIDLIKNYQMIMKEICLELLMLLNMVIQKKHYGRII